MALGVCFSSWSKIDLLKGVLARGDLAQLCGVVTAMDYQRISQAARRISRIRPAIGRPPPEYTTMCLSKLALPIWLHEQSHASRNAISGPAEEVSAQLDAYRGCEESTDDVFGSDTYNSVAVPSCGEMMRGLAKTQPPIYGAIFRIL